MRPRSLQTPESSSNNWTRHFSFPFPPLCPAILNRSIRRWFGLTNPISRPAGDFWNGAAASGWGGVEMRGGLWVDNHIAVEFAWGSFGPAGGEPFVDTAGEVTWPRTDRPD